MNLVWYILQPLNITLFFSSFFSCNARKHYTYELRKEVILLLSFFFLFLFGCIKGLNFFYTYQVVFNSLSFALAVIMWKKRSDKKEL